MLKKLGLDKKVSKNNYSSSIEIKYAKESDLEYIINNDRHISKDLISNKLINNEIILAKNQGDKVVGWLRFNYFWDNTPFMNMLYIDKAYRRIGVGKRLVDFWESEMKNKGYNLVMTSTLSDEQAQFFIESKVIKIRVAYFLKMSH